jgi:8-oxo-dGTP pyrophosphatase MutT (NUDIX family)
MERILRAEEGWEERLAGALRRVPRPIAIDSRFAPRDAALRSTTTPRYERASFPPARPASTLLLLYPDDRGELTVPLTVRHAEMRAHAGEVSLPGGAVDPGDASREAAALREAHEEIGIQPGSVRILGHLDDTWIPVSNFELRPYVGALPRRPALLPQAAEVAAIVELPVRQLLEPDAVTEEEIEVREFRLRAAVYRYAGERIWGATARTLAMFAAVVRLAATDGASGPMSPSA